MFRDRTRFGRPTGINAIKRCILGINRGLAWHRAVAPGVEVGEITTHGLALSRPRRGFESRWGDQISSLRFSAKTFRRRHGRDGKPLRPLICLGERRVFILAGNSAERMTI